MFDVVLPIVGSILGGIVGAKILLEWETSRAVKALEEHIIHLEDYQKMDKEEMH